MTNHLNLTDEQFLDCLGPAWSEMSEAHRACYPHAGPPAVALVEPVSEPPRAMTSRAIAARERLSHAMGKAS